MTLDSCLEIKPLGMGQISGQGEDFDKHVRGPGVSMRSRQVRREEEDKVCLEVRTSRSNSMGQARD